MSRAALLVIYGLSGAAGLLYEVTWSRLLTLHMGQTVAAVSTVLAAFMGGLALGAALAGGRASRLDRAVALRWYAGLELTIGAGALLLPTAIDALEPLLAWAYANGTGGLTFGVTRLATSLSLIVMPTAAMGATLPLATRWFVTGADRAGAHAGGLYAANTIGAAAGAAAAGFLLIPRLGLQATTWVGVAINVAAAAGAWQISAGHAVRLPAVAGGDTKVGASADRTRDARRKARVPSRRAPRTAASSEGSRGPTMPRPAVAGAALAISGFVALVLEVAWTRILALVIGPTVYGFSTMLVAFIGGLAGGAAIGSRAFRWIRQPLVALGGSLMMTAAGALGALWIIDDLPLRIARTVADPNVSFEAVLTGDAVAVAGLLLPMTFALGSAFPFAVAAAVRGHDTIARDVARVYALNTAGAIAGALAGGFLLLPRLGLQDTVVGVSVMALACGVFVVFAVPSGRWTRTCAVAAAAALALAAFQAPPWNRELMSSGAYKYAPYMRDGDLRAGLEAGELVYYAEGSAATVSVRRVAGTLSLAIDGKVDASNAGDMLTQKLLAHLPLLLHRNPKEVCIIGLGSGVTLGAALGHGVASVDMLEISPEVVRAAEYFADDNHAALTDRRARLILGDGRTHLLLGRRQYDVIVSEPSNPWMAGVATLFTKEFFEAARGRLKPGGLLCQWAHTYDITEADLRSIAATFASVFPDGTMWLVGEGDLLFVGGRTPVDIESIAATWNRPTVAADLAEVGVRDPFGVLSLFVAGPDGLARYGRGAAIQTDDHTALEFSAPRGIYGRSPADNAGMLRDLARSLPAPAAVAAATARANAASWRDRGLMLIAAEAFGQAYDSLREALARDATDAAALEALGRAAAGAGRLDEAVTFLKDLSRRESRAPVHLALSRLLASRGDIGGALDAVGPALAAEPDSLAAREQIASVYSDAGDAGRLEPVVRELERVAPERSATVYYAASLRFLRGQFAEAAALAERVVVRTPTDGRALNLLGAAYASQGSADRARKAFQASVRANPRDPATHVNLGMLEMEAANLDRAVGHFAEALSLDPRSVAARGGLADALERQGASDRASEVRRTRQ